MGQLLYRLFVNKFNHYSETGNDKCIIRNSFINVFSFKILDIILMSIKLMTVTNEHVLSVHLTYKKELKLTKSLHPVSLKVVYHHHCL